MSSPSTFKRFVEVGRVVLLKSGPFEGKIAVIVEIIDHRRAIIDGPTTDVPRQAFPYRHIVLTPFCVKDLPRAARTGTVRRHIEKSGVVDKWNNSSWAQKLQKSDRRRKLNDFDRFNIQIWKKNRRDRVRRALKKEASA